MKLFKLLLATLLLPFISAAQSDPPPKTSFRAGVKIGANLSSLDAESCDNGYRVNFLGGAVIGVRANRLGIQAELLFVQSNYQTGASGAQLPGLLYQNIADSARQGSFQVNHLSVPVLFMLRLPGK